jgi:murein DD-endopeptidase MepM/ murein hydrolase activator NlpD
MFFKKANVLFVSFVTIILATLVSAETGRANDLEIDVQSLDYTNEFSAYYRSFEVTSTVTPARHSPKVPSIILPELVWPVDEYRVSSHYGYRQSCAKCSTFHQGTDFDGNLGDPIYAAMDGLIVSVEHFGEYGLFIVIEHVATINTKTERWQTVYAHLQKDSIPENIKPGALVYAGEKIAGMGRTGLATGIHLHFEIRVEGEKVNPYKYLKMYAN